MDDGGKRFVFIGLGVVLCAITLQSVSIGLLGNSIVSNLPWLGSLLTIIDALYLSHYLNSGITIGNLGQFTLRAISLAATGVAVAKYYEWGIYRLKELLNDWDESLSRLIQFLIFAIAVAVHFVAYYFLHVVYVEMLLGSFLKFQELMEKLRGLLDSVPY
ncbi:hypothetical protein [Cohnella sp.]|uniref:hypothetical protein n=1 Tax=Cohnella sp. TaxID=1883426 RepID=UPI003562FC17